MSYEFDNAGSTNLSVATPIASLPLTIACWAKITVDASGSTLVCIGNGTNSEIFRLGASMDGTGDPARFRASTTGNSPHDVFGGTISLNTWHFFAMRASSTSQNDRALFLDGNKYTTSGSNLRNITNATMLALGAQYQAGNYGVDMGGFLAHVGVWDMALSDAQLGDLAAGANPLTIEPDNLVSYWPLTEGLVDVVDGLTLTNSGGASLSADNPAVDAAPSDGVNPATLTSANLMSSPALTVDGELNPASMVSANVMGAPSLSSSLLEILTDDQDADNFNKSSSNVDGNVATFYIADRGESFARGVSFKARMFIPAGVEATVRVDLNSKQTQGAPPGNTNSTGTPWTHVWREIWNEVDDVEVLDADSWAKVSDYSYVGSTTRMASGKIPSAAYDRIVEVALKPTMRASEVLEMYDVLAAGAYAVEPPSCIAARASDPTLAPFRHARLTSGASKNSAPSAVAFEYPAVRVGAGPLRAQWLSDQHAREDGARYAFRVAMMRLATEAGGRYAAFRERFTLDAYAVNLNGNYGGAERHSCESNGSRDTNRYWHNNNSPQVVAVRNATAVDREGKPLANLFDWHGLEGANIATGWCEIYTTPEFAGETELADRVVAIMGTGVINDATPLSDPPYDTASGWGAMTVGAPTSFTIEFGDAAPGYPDAEAMYGDLADAIIDVMIEMADEGWFGALTMPAPMVSANVMGTPLLSAAGAVTPAAIVSANVMGSPALTVSSSASPATMVSANAMGSPTVSAAGSITPPGLVSANVMGSPVLAAHQSVTPATLVSTGVMGSPAISAAGSVVPTPLVSANVMGTPALASHADVSPVAMVSANVMGSPSVTAADVVSPATMVSTGAMGSPALTTKQSVTPATMVSLNVFTGPYFRPPGGNRPPTRRRVNAGRFNRRMAA